MTSFYYVPLLLLMRLPDGVPVATAKIYEVNIQSVELCNNAGSNALDISRLNITKLGSNVIYVNGNAVLKQTITSPTQITGKFFSINNRQMRDTGINFSRDLCSFIASDKDYYPQLQPSSNLPKTCPIQQGTYTINNAKVTVDKLPVFLPNGCFRMNLTATQGSTTLTCITVLARVTPPRTTRVAPC